MLVEFSVIILNVISGDECIQIGADTSEVVISIIINAGINI